LASAIAVFSLGIS